MSTTSNKSIEEIILDCTAAHAREVPQQQTMLLKPPMKTVYADASSNKSTESNKQTTDKVVLPKTVKKQQDVAMSAQYKALAAASAHDVKQGNTDSKLLKAVHHKIEVSLKKNFDKMSIRAENQLGML